MTSTGLKSYQIAVPISGVKAGGQAPILKSATVISKSNMISQVSKSNLQTQIAMPQNTLPGAKPLLPRSQGLVIFISFCVQVFSKIILSFSNSITTNFKTVDNIISSAKHNPKSDTTFPD